ncbi:cyclodeaminase/cyclohydrolase family protein [Paenibacillus montanisoli]|uniref:Methenyltetrahydrofolate cyclohydrolase n=1 Tax=Paenibacillus montanisoli TaxID=2081970 RepID=A0A328TVG2_9BACL|nr:cyclodeaminase/cyclohydrolase family protein [Paenibacillus montanisoli]RAP74507.1 methenyltetrahydrofolate cyclohydrolase [Paenibacillus montanisoli]
MTQVTWDDTIRRFLQQAASSNPTPGGGSAAAVVAALGTAMTAMAAHLTQGDKFADVRPEIIAALHALEPLTQECEALLAADIKAFDGYMHALKLPKETADEQASRRDAIHGAAIAAIEVPLRLMEVCRAGLQATHGIAACTNPHVISDLGIGALLLEAAGQSALLTVDINLAGLKDAAKKEQFAARRTALIAEIIQLKERTLAVVRDSI